MQAILIDLAIKAVLPLLASIVTPFAVKALKRVAAKYELQINDEQERQIEKLVDRAVHSVEEMATSAARDGKKPTPAGKLAAATETVLKARPDMSAGEAQDRIHAALAVKGLGASTAGPHVA